jgi:hypothetical protein
MTITGALVFLGCAAIGLLALGLALCAMSADSNRQTDRQFRDYERERRER